MNSAYRSITTNGVNQNHGRHRNKRKLNVVDATSHSSPTKKLDPEIIQFLNTLPWKEEGPSKIDDGKAFTDIIPVNTMIDMAVPNEINVIVPILSNVPVSPTNQTQSRTNVHPNVIESSTDSIDGIDVEPFDINADSASSCEESITMMDLEPLHNLIDETECDDVLEVLSENSLQFFFPPPMPLASSVELVKTSQSPQSTNHSIAEPVKSLDTTPLPSNIHPVVSQDTSEMKPSQETAPLPSTVDPEAVMLRLKQLMKKSAETQSDLQEWDKKRGLPKSHSPTMVNSSRSRKQLQEGIILRKWNAAPLISVPGEGLSATPSKRARIHQSQ